VASKIALAHERAARVSTLSGGSLLLGLSGKDSFVTLDIAASHFKRIVCCHYYTVRGMRCLEAPFEALVKRYPNAELMYVPHWDLARLMKYAVLRPHLNAMDNMRTMKKGDTEALARKRSGIDWISYGERLSDSFARRLFWRKLDGIYEKGRRCTFIPEWLDADVNGYMVAKKLPQPCTFTDDHKRSSGFELTPNCLRWLKQHHPRDFETVLKVFPAAYVQTMDIT
jgi:3'-phosphoadenosine 5'-phosphosulfate sulfotransferase (PAPS reductase)/FAD synthetase